MRSINLVVIHCAATPNGVWVTPAQIDAWHKAAGFRRDAAYAAKFRPHLPHIGYHRVIQVNGEINYGRDLDEIGAHARGFNANSVGICIVGMDRYFGGQWEALRDEVCRLALGIADRRRHPVPATLYPTPSVTAARALYAEMGVRITGHRELSPDIDGDGTVEPNEWLKTCPGFDVPMWLSKGMEPEGHAVLDGHPAIAARAGVRRAMAAMRYGGL